MLGSERLSGFEQQQQGGAVTGLETAPLGRGEALLGELEVGQDLESLACAVEAGFEARGERAEGRSAARGRPHDAEWRRKELASLDRALGQTIGADQRQRLLTFEPVAARGSDHILLFLCAERAERVGLRHAELARVELLLQRLAELLGQGEPHVDPVGFATANLGDRLGPQLLLVTQLMNHSSLVHRRERAGRSVGLEQRDQLLRGRAWRLHDHRHSLDAELSPAPKALESVDQLVGAIRGRHHPQR